MTCVVYVGLFAFTVYAVARTQPLTPPFVFFHNSMTRHGPDRGLQKDNSRGPRKRACRHNARIVNVQKVILNAQWTRPLSTG